MPTPGRVVLADNLAVLRELPDASVDLIYVDPPFNTGQARVLQQIKTTRDDDGDRVGFQGHRYRTLRLGSSRYVDVHDDYLAFVEPRIVEFQRVLQPHGSLYFHIDYREAHYCKILLDLVFGRDCFLNEIIWAYDFGGRPSRRWPAKHDTILVYVKDPVAPLLRRRGRRAHPVHGARPGRAGEGGARQAPDRHLVAHDRAARRQGAHRLSDAEAARHPAADRAGVVAARWRWSPTSSPAAAPPARPAWSLAAASCWSTTTRRRSTVMRRRFADHPGIEYEDRR